MYNKIVGNTIMFLSRIEYICLFLEPKYFLQTMRLSADCCILRYIIASPVKCLFFYYICQFGFFVWLRGTVYCIICVCVCVWRQAGTTCCAVLQCSRPSILLSCKTYVQEVCGYSCRWRPPSPPPPRCRHMSRDGRTPHMNIRTSVVQDRHTKFLLAYKNTVTILLE